MPPLLLHCVCLHMSYSKHLYSVACLAGVKRGKGGGIWMREEERKETFLSFLPCTPKFPLPLPLNVHTTIPIWDMINTHYTVPDIL